MKYFLTIAASDNSSGAGIQQDLKTAKDFGCWGLSAITAITSQNFNKTFFIKPLESTLVKQQINACCKYFPIDAIKIGVIGSINNAIIITKAIKKYKLKNIVFDPVIISSSGKYLTDKQTINFIKTQLFPLCDLITPNKIELELFANKKIDNISDAISIVKEKSNEWKTNILIKGGHFNSPIIYEAIIHKNVVYTFQHKRLTFNYSHGTGCTLSSAIACLLANNINIIDAYKLASRYLLTHYKKLNYLF